MRTVVAVRRADCGCGGEWSGARGAGPAARPSIKYSIVAPPAVYRRRSRDSRHSYRAPPSFQNGRHPVCVEREAVAAAATVYEKARENRGKSENKYIYIYTSRYVRKENKEKTLSIRQSLLRANFF